MTGECRITVRIQREDFDLAQEAHDAVAGNANAGAVVTFSGLCRDEGGRLAALELEHYPAMAEKEIGGIAMEAAGRWPVSALTVVHRHGLIEPGRNIVLVVAVSSHRQAAFEAASFLMDYLKTRAPFWKKEHLADGSTGEWVEAAQGDEDAARKWQD